MLDKETAMKRLLLLQELYKVLDNNLPILRIGAMLYKTHPDLGDFFIDITTPQMIDDPEASALNESSVRLTAADDNHLQSVIEMLRTAKEHMEKED